MRLSAAYEFCSTFQVLAVSCGSKTQRAAGSKTLSTLVLCAAAAAGLSQMGGRGAYYKAKYGGGRGRGGGRKGSRGGHLPPPPPGQARGGTGEDLRAFLRSLERQSYGAYQELRGTAWTLQRGVQLKIDQCQKDAFAPPSRCRVVFEGAAAQLPNEAYATQVSRVACLLYTSPSPRDQRGSRMPSSA